MGINLGAFIAPLVCGYLGQRVSWHAGFGAAGIGMTLGLVQYVLGARNLGDAGLRPAQPVDQKTRTIAGVVTGALLLIAIALFTGIVPITAKQIADTAGAALLGGTIVFFGWLLLSSGWTPLERRRLYAIAILFIAATLFWSQFEQAGSTLNLFGDRATRTEVAGWTF